METVEQEVTSAAGSGTTSSRREGRTITVHFELKKATKNALQYTEVVPEDQPERMGTLYLKKWLVPQPYAQFISATILIPVGHDVTSGGKDPAKAAAAAAS